MEKGEPDSAHLGGVDRNYQAPPRAASTLRRWINAEGALSVCAGEYPRTQCYLWFVHRASELIGNTRWLKPLLSHVKNADGPLHAETQVLLSQVGHQFSVSWLPSDGGQGSKDNLHLFKEQQTITEAICCPAGSYLGKAIGGTNAIEHFYLRQLNRSSVQSPFENVSDVHHRLYAHAQRNRDWFVSAACAFNSVLTKQPKGLIATMVCNSLGLAGRWRQDFQCMVYEETLSNEMNGTPSRPRISQALDQSDLSVALIRALAQLHRADDYGGRENLATALLGLEACYLATQQLNPNSLPQNLVNALFAKT